MVSNQSSGFSIFILCSISSNIAEWLFPVHFKNNSVLFIFHPLFLTFICHFCHFVDLPRAAVRILSNLTFLFVSLSYTAESAIVTAFITFIPKFIESQFGIPASNASIYTGKALPQSSVKTWACVTTRLKCNEWRESSFEHPSVNSLTAASRPGFRRRKSLFSLWFRVCYCVTFLPTVFWKGRTLHIYVLMVFSWKSEIVHGIQI